MTKRKKNPKPHGRPSLYRPEHCEKMIEIGARGGFIPAICRALRIRSETTFYTWLKQYPEFAEAYETSKLYAKAFHEETLNAQAIGKNKGSHAALKQILQTKFKEEYREDSARPNVSFNIGTMNNVTQLSNKELEDRINFLIRKNESPVLEGQVIEAQTEESIHG